MPIAWAVQSKDGKPPSWACQFKIVEGPGDQGGWDDWSTYDFELTGYFYFIKNDRTPNAKTIDSMKAALGWDGVDIAWLNDADFSKTLVQIDVKSEVYNGESKLKVAWLNPHDYSGGGNLEKMDASVLKTVSAQWGSSLRANAGPAQTRPTSPPARPPLRPTLPANG